MINVQVEGTEQVQFMLKKMQGWRPKIVNRFAEKAKTELIKATPLGETHASGDPIMRDSWVLEKGGTDSIIIKNISPHAKHVIRGYPGYIYPKVKKKMKFFHKGMIWSAAKVRGQKPQPILQNVIQNTDGILNVIVRRLQMELK